MNNIVSDEHAIIDFMAPTIVASSPYDNAYPVELLSKGLRNRLDMARNTAMEVYKAVIKQAPILAQTQQALKKGYKLVVDATESTLEAIETGRVKLTTDKSGRTFAQIREANGQFGSKLPIKKEYARKGFDSVQMANALQMMALQEQIQAIANQISIIDRSVRDVLHGQQNDRIGLYYSGMALFLESRSVSDNDLKKSLVAQALRALSEATYQLTLTMQSDIQYLANKEYLSAKGKSAEMIDRHMQSINQSFAFIHQSTMLRAGIYCDQGELPAMATVLESYSHFIDETVVKNASLLAQCDTADDGSDSGVWKSRATLKLDASSLVNHLIKPEKTVYLSVMEENK